MMMVVMASDDSLVSRAGRLTVVIVTALAALTAEGAGASGAPPGCHIVTDPRGDEGLVAGVPDPPGLGSDSLDLRAGNIAANRSYFTVAITVTNLRALDLSPDARAWNFLFDTATGAVLDFQATWAPSGATTFYVAELTGNKTVGYYGTAVAQAHGLLDTARNQIVMTARVADLKSYLADRQGYLGRPLRNLHLEASRQVRTETPPSSNGYIEDEAFSNASYKIGEPSCMPVRKY